MDIKIILCGSRYLDLFKFRRLAPVAPFGDPGLSATAILLVRVRSSGKACGGDRISIRLTGCGRPRCTGWTAALATAADEVVAKTSLSESWQDLACGASGTCWFRSVWSVGWGRLEVAWCGVKGWAAATLDAAVVSNWTVTPVDDEGRMMDEGWSDEEKIEEGRLDEGRMDEVTLDEVKFDAGRIDVWCSETRVICGPPSESSLHPASKGLVSPRPGSRAAPSGRSRLRPPPSPNCLGPPRAACCCSWSPPGGSVLLAWAWIGASKKSPT